MTSLNKKHRNPWIDYLKAFAIYLVIVGHMMTNCMSKGSELKVTGIIYFIHIPLFLIISGCLVKDKRIDRNFWIGLIKRFLVPYTVWTMILTTFYQGFSHLMHDGFLANIQIYFNNWCHSFLWFIKAYLITYILWQALQRMPCWWRLGIGTIVLVFVNILTLESKSLSELASLSLYSYTLFGIGACVGKYIDKINVYWLAIMTLSFFLCLPFATPANNYFECSFGHMVQFGSWHVFFIRFMAGTCFSFALISIGRLCKRYSPPIQNITILQGIGQRTLQIYMLQSLLVEAVLNRIINFQMNNYGIIWCFALSAVLTLLCYVIVEKTIKMKIIGPLLWGTN